MRSHLDRVGASTRTRTQTSTHTHTHLLHDTSFSFAEGNVSSTLVLDELDVDATPAALLARLRLLGRLIVAAVGGVEVFVVHVCVRTYVRSIVRRRLYCKLTH